MSDRCKCGHSKTLHSVFECDKCSCFAYEPSVALPMERIANLTAELHSTKSLDQVDVFVDGKHIDTKLGGTLEVLHWCREKYGIEAKDCK